jgi:hypothetical protein
VSHGIGVNACKSLESRGFALCSFELLSTALTIWRWERGGRKMGESDLLLGPHEQSIGGIGRTTHRRGGDPYASYGPHAPWAWRTHKIASPAPSPQHAPGLRRRHRDRRTASTPAIAAAAAKNIAKKSASYAHANPRLKQETSAIIVSSRTLASNPPLLAVHRRIREIRLPPLA